MKEFREKNKGAFTEFNIVKGLSNLMFLNVVIVIAGFTMFLAYKSGMSVSDADPLAGVAEMSSQVSTMLSMAKVIKWTSIIAIIYSILEMVFGYGLNIGVSLTILGSLFLRKFSSATLTLFSILKVNLGADSVTSILDGFSISKLGDMESAARFLDKSGSLYV